MPVTRTVAAALVGVVVLGIAGATARGDITVQSWSLTVWARAGGEGEAKDTATGTGLPPPPSGWQHTHDAQHEAAEWTSNAWTHYDFWAGGDVGSFYFNFDHHRAGLGGSQAQSYGELYFTAGEGLLYSLDGAYSLLGDQCISLSVVLEDLTEPEIKFSNTQESNSTTNQAFILGGLAGDQEPFLDGALAGSLMGGRIYRLRYDYLINASASSNNGANAVGFLQMNLDPIPAPGAALLGVIGLGTVACARRRIA